VWVCECFLHCTLSLAQCIVIGHCVFVCGSARGGTSYEKLGGQKKLQLPPLFQFAPIYWGHMHVFALQLRPCML